MRILEALGLKGSRRDTIAAEIETTSGSRAKALARIAELQAEQRALLVPSIEDPEARARLDALTALVRTEQDVAALLHDQVGRLEAELRSLDAADAKAAARAAYADAAAKGEAVVAAVARVEGLVAELIAAEADVDAAVEAFRAAAPPTTQRYPGHGGLSNLRTRIERYVEMQRAIARVGAGNVIGEAEYRTRGGLSAHERRLIAETMPPDPDARAPAADQAPPPAAA